MNEFLKILSTVICIDSSIPDMTYDVFGGTLSLTQSINHCIDSLKQHHHTRYLPVIDKFTVYASCCRSCQYVTFSAAVPLAAVCWSVKHLLESHNLFQPNGFDQL